MEDVVPWKALIDLIEPHYPKTSSKGGRPPYPLVTTLRIHLLKQWYDLSDPAIEDELIEVPTMRRFAAIGMISDRIPDETTILAFRHLLQKHDHQCHLDWGTLLHLYEGEARVRRRRQNERDPEMHQACKGKRWYFGELRSEKRCKAAGSASACSGAYRAKGEHRFRVIKQQFGFQKTRLL